MKLVYICSPYAGDTPAQIKKHVFQAYIYCRLAFDAGNFPIAPHCYLPNFLDDENKREREKALRFGIKALDKCAELWVFGEYISGGMRNEIEHAKSKNKVIRYFDRQGYEIKGE